MTISVSKRQMLKDYEQAQTFAPSHPGPGTAEFPMLAIGLGPAKCASMGARNREDAAGPDDQAARGGTGVSYDNRGLCSYGRLRRDPSVAGCADTDHGRTQLNATVSFAGGRYSTT